LVHIELAEAIMTRSLVCVHPDQELIEVEQLLIRNHISGAPVVEGERLVGVISRSDIARVEVLMKSLDGQVSDALNWDVQADGFQHSDGQDFQGFRQELGKLHVKDAMHDQVVTCGPKTPVAEVAEQMIRGHIHRVIVVDGTRPVGIVSSLDIVRLVADPQVPAAGHKN